MQVGYARTSTVEQEAGIRGSIEAAQGCRVREVCSRSRFQQLPPSGTSLRAALEFAREGDAFVVTKLDRLARSVAHLVAIGERLEGEGGGVEGARPGHRHVDAYRKAHVQHAGGHCSVRAGTDPRADAGRHRQGQGGRKYKGRAPTARAKSDEVRSLHAEGVSPTEIAKRLRISRTSVYRALWA